MMFLLMEPSFHSHFLFRFFQESLASAIDSLKSSVSSTTDSSTGEKLSDVIANLSDKFWKFGQSSKTSSEPEALIPAETMAPDPESAIPLETMASAPEAAISPETKAPESVAVNPSEIKVSEPDVVIPLEATQEKEATSETTEANEKPKTKKLFFAVSTSPRRNDFDWVYRDPNQ